MGEKGHIIGANAAARIRAGLTGLHLAGTCTSTRGGAAHARTENACDPALHAGVPAQRTARPGGSGAHLRTGHPHQPAGARAAEGARLLEHLPQRQRGPSASAAGRAQPGSRGAGARRAPGSGSHRSGRRQQCRQDPPVHPHRLCPAQPRRAAHTTPAHPRARHRHAGRHGDAGAADRRAAGGGVRSGRHRRRPGHHALPGGTVQFHAGQGTGRPGARARCGRLRQRLFPRGHAGALGAPARGPGTLLRHLQPLRQPGSAGAMASAVHQRDEHQRLPPA